MNDKNTFGVTEDKETLRTELMKKYKFLPYLKRGKSEAIKREDLTTLAGYQNLCTLKADMSRARKNPDMYRAGLYICSCGAGVYLADSVKDIKAFAFPQLSVAHTIFVTLQPYLAKIDLNAGQLEFSPEDMKIMSIAERLKE